MLQQRLAAELRQHIDGIDARVDEIAENEVDDPVFPAKRNGRFGPLLGERKEPRPFSARQHDSQDAYAHSYTKPYCFRLIRAMASGTSAMLRLLEVFS